MFLKKRLVGLFVKFVQRRHVSEEVLARTEMGEGGGEEGSRLRIKTDRDENRISFSLIVRDKVTRRCPCTDDNF